MRRAAVGCQVKSFCLFCGACDRPALSVFSPPCFKTFPRGPARPVPRGHGLRRPPQPVPQRLEVFLLGRFEVRRDGLPVQAWPRAAVRRLLKLLALAPQHRLSLTSLAESLWPQDHGERVRQRLHHLVYLLRGVLDPDGGQAGLLRVSDGVLQLAPEVLWVDAPAFERAAAQALRAADGPAPAEPAALAERLAGALTLYGGPLLPDDIDEPALHAQRQHLERLQAELLHALADVQARQGQATPAMRSLQQLLQRQPADERAHRALIRLYAQARRRDEAERQYAACRAALADELGVSPSAETHQAYREALLADDAPGAASLPGVLGQPVVLASGAHALRLHPPAPLVPLIDRDTLVQQLAERLADPSTRLLTLVGPGGMGKTQLALRLAHELQGRYRHGAAFVSLAEVDAARGSEGVADRLRRSLRLAEPAGIDTLQALADALRERHLLLVCDNCEHLTPHLGLITELLTHCPLLTVLATSRRRLNLRAEQLVEVPGLTPTDDSGLRLFAQRAAAASPGFALDARQREDVRAIVQQLGGLPLAIELVAARVALLPPAALRKALAQGAEVVAGGGPDRPARHRSMQASLAWSRSLLSTLERAVLDRAALFVAPFEWPALAAVCADLAGEAEISSAAQTLGELGLLARSPVLPGAAPRWQRPVADVPLAAPAAAVPTPSPAAPAAAAHVTPPEALAGIRWFAGRATQLAAALAGSGDEAQQALAAFDADHEHFFAALAQARRGGHAALLCQTVQGLAGYWARSGAWHRADPWVLQATQVAAGLPPAEQAALAMATSAYWHDCQRFDRTRDVALQVQALARRLGDARLHARATVRLASALYHLGEAEAAIAQLRPLCEQPQAHGLDAEADAPLHRAALNNLANALLCGGELAAAHAAWQACDAQLPDALGAARVPYLHNLALVAHYEGRHADAAQRSAQAEACEQADAPRPQRLALLRLRRCWMACCQGDAAAAAQALGDARQAVAMGQLAAWQPVCAAHDGKLALLAGQAERAQALLQRALDLGQARGQDQGDPWDTLDSELWLIHTRLALASRGAAPAAVAQALSRLATRFGHSWRLEHARILEAAAAWLLRADEASAAAQAWQQAQALRRQLTLPRFAIEQGLARRTQATLASRLGSSWRQPGQGTGRPHPSDVAREAPLAWLLPLLA